MEKTIDPFDVHYAEVRYPTPRFVKWWYDRFGEYAIRPIWRWSLMGTFFLFFAIAICFDVYEIMNLRDISIAIGGTPVVVVVLSGFYAVITKNITVGKRIEYLGVTREEYNKIIRKLETQ